MLINVRTALMCFL